MDEHRIGRQQIIDALAGGLEPLPSVHAAWLGGSDASGRTDVWSDVDFQALVDDDSIERAYEAVHRSLEALSPIRYRYRFPQPTWHGHEQELLALRDAAPFHFLDLVLIRKSATDRFLEEERHGRPLVLFDKAGEVAPVPLDRQAHAEKIRRRLETLRGTFFLYQNLVVKAALRGAAADAVQTYMGATIRLLVELLRMRHCPDRFDYGLRYLDRDLPADLHAEIERLVLPGDLRTLLANQERAESLFRQTLEDLDQGEWVVG